jgi:deoxyribodipyrimidine photo-lyase
VWLTAESPSDADPAMAANPDLPVAFVFDRPLLNRLQLSSKRLVFLVETLAELATHRQLELHLGDPVEVLAEQPLATTFAPVPGWRARSSRLNVAELHPWPWLRTPVAGTVGSFSGWRKQLDRLS